MRHVQISLDLAAACQATYEGALTLLAMAELRAATGEIEATWTLLDEVKTICNKEGDMENFGIFDPRLVQRVKEEWQRAAVEVRRATAPLRDEAERIFDGAFRAPATGPTTPLDGCDWQRVGDDEEALRGRLERTIANLTVVRRQTVTLGDPGSAAAMFTVRAVLTDDTLWQARIPATALARATESELRLWALRLVGKVRQ